MHRERQARPHGSEAALAYAREDSTGRMREARIAALADTGHSLDTRERAAPGITMHCAFQRMRMHGKGGLPPYRSRPPCVMSVY